MSVRIIGLGWRASFRNSPSCRFKSAGYIIKNRHMPIGIDIPEICMLLIAPLRAGKYCDKNRPNNMHAATHAARYFSKTPRVRLSSANEILLASWLDINNLFLRTRTWWLWLLCSYCFTEQFKFSARAHVTCLTEEPWWVKTKYLLSNICAPSVALTWVGMSSPFWSGIVSYVLRCEYTWFIEVSWRPGLDPHSENHLVHVHHIRKRRRLGDISEANYFGCS